MSIVKCSVCVNVFKLYPLAFIHKWRRYSYGDNQELIRFITICKAFVVSGLQLQKVWCLNLAGGLAVLLGRFTFLLKNSLYVFFVL